MAIKNWDDTPHFDAAMRYFATYKYGNPLEEKEKAMATNKLYQITHTIPDSVAKSVSYGHKLAVDSAGRWVMELKGTGEVRSFDKSVIEEVMPYTISVQFESNKQIYSYLATKDQVELNAFYIFDAALGRAIAQVVKLDTKSPAATAEFKPLAKLTTVPV